MSIKQNKPERIVILSKGFGSKWESEFFNQIQEAFDNGYKIAGSNKDHDRSKMLRADTSMRNYRGHEGRCVMYLEGCDPLDVTLSKKEEPLKDELPKEPVVETKEPEKAPAKKPTTKKPTTKKKTTPKGKSSTK